MFATLMYHIVDRRIRASIAVAEEAFEAQLAHVRREGYTVLTLDDVLAIVTGSQTPPRDGVFVTFDDGYSDNLSAALPCLRKHGVEATMFVPTAYVGQSNGWNTTAGYEARHLDWRGLERWVAGGGRIGGHTHEHTSVHELERDELRETLALNKRLLEERLGQEVRSFSYPYGDVSAEARAEVARLYDVAFSVTQGTWDHRVDHLTLNRLAVDHNYRVRDFAHALERLFTSFEEQARNGGEHVFEQFPASPVSARGRPVAGLTRTGRKRQRAIRLVEIGVEWPPEPFLQQKFERLSHAGVDVRVVACLGRSEQGPRLAGYRLVPLRPWGDSSLRAGIGMLGHGALLLASRPRRLLTVARTRRAWGGAGWPGVRQWLLAVRLARLRGDIVQFEWLVVALRWAQLFDALGQPVVVSCRGAEITAYPHMPRWSARAAALPALFRRAAAVHCVSTDVVSEGVRYGLDPETSSLIRPAVDAAFFRPSLAGSQSGPALRLVSVGQIRWLKGYEYTLLAVADLARGGIPVLLDLIGGGPSPGMAQEREHDRIRWTIADLGLEEQVRVSGELSQTGVRDRVQAADVLLHLSLTEGIPNVVLEAMACGVPVVATDVGGTGEAVTDGVEGFLVSPRDPRAAAAALERLWHDPALRARMGAAGRARVEADFTLDAQTKRFVALYEGVAACRRPGLARPEVSATDR